jgi:acetyltransferase-like isoleucine patch superfamily enzyme
VGLKVRLVSKLRRFVHFARRVRDSYVGQELATWRRLQKQGRVVLGPHTYGIPDMWVYEGGERLVAGSYCSLRGTFLLGGQHAVDQITTYPIRINWGLPGAWEDGFPTPQGDTHVGSDVWVGRGALVMSGITIGDAAIVAGGAVVTKDVPAYAIVGGNPAKVIRYRFTEQQMAALTEIKWWDWSDAEVLEALPMMGKDIDGFIEYAYAKMGRRDGAANASR